MNSIANNNWKFLGTDGLGSTMGMFAWKAGRLASWDLEIMLSCFPLHKVAVAVVVELNCCVHSQKWGSCYDNAIVKLSNIENATVVLSNYNSVKFIRSIILDWSLLSTVRVIKAEILRSDLERYSLSSRTATGCSVSAPSYQSTWRYLQKLYRLQETLPALTFFS